MRVEGRQDTPTAASAAVEDHARVSTSEFDAWEHVIPQIISKITSYTATVRVVPVRSRSARSMLVLRSTLVLRDRSTSHCSLRL